MTQAFSPSTTQASGSFWPAYNEISSPKQTENYKKLPSGGTSPGNVEEIRMPGRHPAGDRTEPHFGPLLLRRGLWRPPPDTSPEAGRACTFSTGPRTRYGARTLQCARTRGRMRECEATFLGHSESLHQLEDGRREGSQRPCRYP